MLTGDALDSAVAYNKGRGYTRAETRRVQETVEAEPVDGYFGPDTTQAIAVWQDARGLDADGKLGATSWRYMIKGWWETRPFDDEAMHAVTDHTIMAETGGEGYASHNKDTEFKYMDGYDYHVGSSLGIINCAQDPGTVGDLFTEWARIDREDFERWMVDGDELLHITNSTGSREIRIEGDEGKRRPCVMPIADFDFWDDAGPWPARHRAAAEGSEAYRQAQDNIMSRDYLNPALEFARQFGWRSEADIAILFDMCVQMGVSGVANTHWPRVWDQRPSNARCLLDHLSPRDRDRREKILAETAWWITYDI